MHMTNSTISFLMNATKDVIQIIFFIVVAIVTVLSYKQAKKTLFTPLKTEIFKMQLDIFRNLLIYFENKTDIDFYSQFDYESILKYNFDLLITDYLSTFFRHEYELKKEYKNEIMSKFSGVVCSKKAAYKYFKKINYIQDENERKKESITSSESRLCEWTKYEYDYIGFTSKFSEEMKKIQSFQTSPILPIGVKDEIVAFNRIAHENLSKIGLALTKIAQELPLKIKTPNDVYKIQYSGLWNKYHNEIESFMPTAENMLNNIKNYLKIEEILT